MSAENLPKYENIPSKQSRGSEDKNRLEKLTEMSMSNYQACQSGFRKPRIKLKPRLKSSSAITFPLNSVSGELPIVISDEKGGNVVLLDGKKKRVPLREIISGIKPYGLTPLDLDTVAVVDGSTPENLIRIVSISSDRKEFGKWRKESQEWQPRGLALTKKGHVVVTNVHPKSSERLDIFTPDGRLVNSFGRSSGPGDQCFRRPENVAVDIFGRIISTDIEGNCVKIFDNRGRWLKEFGNVRNSALDGASDGNHDPLLCRPQGICCDSLGNILVCDSGNNRLAMFSHDGRFIGDLLKRESRPAKVKCPVAVTFSSLANQVAVCIYDSSDSFKQVAVYDFGEIETK